MAHTSTFTKNRHEENMNASSRYCPPNSRPSTRAASDPPSESYGQSEGSDTRRTSFLSSDP